MDQVAKEKILTYFFNKTLKKLAKKSNLTQNNGVCILWGACQFGLREAGRKRFKKHIYEERI